MDNLSLTIAAGEFVSLLGPSGCGKSTTLRIIAGFEHPDAGEITISGRPVVGVPPYQRDVNTVFQAYALFPHMSVAQNVAYGLQQRRTPKEEIFQRVSDALNLVHMRTFAERKPSQLSGGQQQRVALARALVNEPSVLLLDEPLAALDRQLREEMQVELKLLQQRLGITFIFVTHDQGEALSMSDRIAVLRNGRVEQMDDPDTVYNNPSTAYVAGFIGQQNFFNGQLSDDGDLITDFGVLRTDQSSRSSEHRGTSVLGAIRPEHIEIALAGPEPTVGEGLNARLIDASHHGEVRQYIVERDRGGTLVVRSPALSAPSIPLGSDVVCTWQRSSVRIFPADNTICLDSTTTSSAE
ncbi:ABC transporter ATP-binding protein [Mycolicibacterium sp. YH-1]|uniref:ABC transporter ATP-binding protein n=1 Tax=Mycolicibacterium sp. YH-1 TaxID=2908837 RepID=UPI001F4C073F|nr:ABC transporter ATP-binding protein [Mycolicibacterium sp. YH-1]UNB54459.1 ABC transporter ATP-binding protein [Mycolicibacterium sp. YH-1]